MAQKRVGNKTTLMATFCLAPLVIEKLEHICKVRHQPSKSKMVAMLIEAEHLKQIQAQEEQYPT